MSVNTYIDGTWYFRKKFGYLVNSALQLCLALLRSVLPETATITDQARYDAMPNTVESNVLPYR